MKKNGLFITFEGIDGSGKSTIIESVKNALKQKIQNKELNYNDVFKTREPGGANNPFCERIRSLILNNQISLDTEIMLFAANRVEHLNQVILPNLDKNNIVMSDRFIDSSLVYQGIAKLDNWKKVYKINKSAFTQMPDITFLLNITPEEAMKRMSNDQERVWDRFDNEEIKFKNKIQQGFLTIAKKFKKRFVVIDARNSIEEITKEIVNKICQHK